ISPSSGLGLGLVRIGYFCIVYLLWFHFGIITG
ncbi:Uncharacterized protein BM_BM13647, partial [Brugia malayi]